MLTPRPNQNSVLKGGVLTGIQFYQNSCSSWISRGAFNLPCFLKAILFFTIWAATQTYADFEVQVCAVLGQHELMQADLARATEHVVSLLLRGCGLN